VSTSALDERPAGITNDAPFVPVRIPSRLNTTAAVTAATGLLMVGALLLARRSGLWLDEAQSVAIAQLPLAEVFDALRTDGAPPLYYVLLHGWMNLFGDGHTAVRAFSAVCAVATVPFALAAARRTIGRSALVAGVVLASAPFLYRYGTEARMYALVILLVAVGWWLLTTNRIPALAVVSGLLLLTHYWAFFLVAAAVLGAVFWLRRPTVAVALAAGGLFVIPWLPTLWYQVRHTGAPWGPPAKFDVFELALRGFAGGGTRMAFVGIAYFALAVLAVRHSRIGRRLAITVAVPLLLGMAVSAATGAAFADRYAAIVFLPFVGLVAVGLRHVGTRRTARIALATVVAAGLVTSGIAVWRQRTQGPSIAAALNLHAVRGDLIVFCPDQLGPGVMRLLETHLATSAYPAGDSGHLVNWVGYKERNMASEPTAFAAAVHQRTPGSVWVVASPGYRTFGRKCTTLVEEMRRLRPGDERVVKLKRSSYEHASLWRFPAANTGRGAG
jgi:mannosyltransferase